MKDGLAKTGCLAIFLGPPLIASLVFHGSLYWFLWPAGLIIAMLAAAAIGGLFPPNRTPQEMADQIQKLLETQDWMLWDEFSCVRVKDPHLEQIRLRCAVLDYWTEEGRAELTKALEQLRTEIEEKHRNS